MTKRYNKPLTLKELAAMPDEDIDYSDIPKATAEFWASAERIEPKDRESDRSAHPSSGAEAMENAPRPNRRQR